MPAFSRLAPAVPFEAAAYGLRLASNVAIPGLRPASGHDATDVEITLEALPSGFDARDAASVAPTASGITIWVQSGYYRIRYADRTEFAVSVAGDRVYAVWPECLSLEDTTTYLLGPIFSLLLRLRGTVTLHASAVRIGDGAVVLVGPQGAGKSTTAASFAQAGFAVLTDDIAALCDDDDSFRVIPAYPRIRLWPNSVEMLFGSHDALPLLTPTWDKRFLELDDGAHRFESDPLRLAAIYFIQQRSDDEDAPRTEAEPMRDGLIKLIGNLGGTYTSHAESQKNSFTVLDRMARMVPLRRLIPHSDAARLPELRAAIVADVEALLAQHAGPVRRPDV